MRQLIRRLNTVTKCDAFLNFAGQKWCGTLTLPISVFETTLNHHFRVPIQEVDCNMQK